MKNVKKYKMPVSWSAQHSNIGQNKQQIISLCCKIKFMVGKNLTQMLLRLSKLFEIEIVYFYSHHMKLTDLDFIT